MSLARAAALMILLILGGFVFMRTSAGLLEFGASGEVDSSPARAPGAGDGARRVALNSRAPEAVDQASLAGHTRALELARDNTQGVDALDAGDLDLAVTLFEGCVAGGPDEPIFQRNLAEALARRAAVGRTAGDVELRERSMLDLVRAIELDPARTDLTEFLARWRKSAEAEHDFWRKQTDHFEFSFDGTRDELMWGTAPLENELEAAYHEFGELFDLYPVEAGRARFRVVLYRPETFGSVTGLDDWAAGAFDGTVRVPVEDLSRETERLRSVLRHELIHAFVHEVGGARVPGWLNEGFAQLQEPPFRNERLPLLNKAKATLRGADLFSLEELRGSLISWTDRDAIELAYAQSLAFVAYVERMYSERVLIDMIAGCKQGRSPEETFVAELGVELDVVLEDFTGAY
ncbi:MAG: hypothetical protein ACI8QZ_002214 [Chlamydiales bacterium]|jgi:hypothetical protein